MGIEFEKRGGVKMRSIVAVVVYCMLLSADVGMCTILGVYIDDEEKTEIMDLTSEYRCGDTLTISVTGTYRAAYYRSLDDGTYFYVEGYYHIGYPTFWISPRYEARYDLIGDDIEAKGVMVLYGEVDICSELEDGAVELRAGVVNQRPVDAQLITPSRVEIISVSYEITTVGVEALQWGYLKQRYR